VILCDGWPDAISSRNAFLNDIAGTQLPEGVMASCYQALRGCGEDKLSHLRKNEGL